MRIGFFQAYQPKAFAPSVFKTRITQQCVILFPSKHIWIGFSPSWFSASWSKPHQVIAMVSCLSSCFSTHATHSRVSVLQKVGDKLQYSFDHNLQSTLNDGQDTTQSASSTPQSPSPVVPHLLPPLTSSGHLGCIVLMITFPGTFWAGCLLCLLYSVLSVRLINNT